MIDGRDPIRLALPAGGHDDVKRGPRAGTAQERRWWHAAAGAGLVALTAAILLMLGREPICRCGSVKLWHGVVFSAENSQHLTDWYTVSHVIHGFVFYALLWLAASRWPASLRLVGAIALEATWEVVENTDFIIDRYREATIALDYYGDSVLNSVSDIAAMIVGFWLASRMRVSLVIALTIVLELFVAWFIRDNLTLNIIMLLHPIDAIREWQSAA